MIRNKVKHILCMHCQTPQVPDNNYCINCEQELANYFCNKCILYDNDVNKDIYHCDKKPGEEVVEISPDNNGGEHEHIVDFDANIMRLVQTNLESNFGIDLQQ
ncbi:unnamed protein product [Candida parapsilosis]